MKNPKLLRQISDYTLSFKNLIVLFLLFGYYCVNGQMAGQTVTYTTTPGNLFIPAGVTNITVGVWGGGGAGGGCTANNNNSGGGGAGGSYSFGVLACNPGDSLRVIVGAGGLGASAAAGGNGGQSSVQIYWNGIPISANGGQGGAAGSGGNGAGAGGIETIGGTWNGGAGAAGTGTGSGASGGGGGGAGSGGSGGAGMTTTGGIGGIGFTPGGNGANGSGTAGNGASATTLSGGGAGARNGGGGIARAGGDGFRGQVIIFYGGCDDGTLLLTSAMGTDNQNFCLGSDLTDITYSVGGDATGATLSSGAFPDGVAGSFNAGVYTITGTPTEFGIFNYTISTTGSNPCNEASVSGTITVSPYATIADGNYNNPATWAGGCVPPNPIPNGVTVSITHNLTNTGTLTNNGIIMSSLPFTNTGTYQGNGTFEGPDFINNGIVNPGN